MSEEAEVVDAVQRGIDIYAGFRDEPDLPARYDVEGVMLPRPFAITKIGPVALVGYVYGSGLPGPLRVGLHTSC
jgi:hypothetical protein